MAEFDALHKLANRLQALKKQAKALGMFTNDREFLECLNCARKTVKRFFGPAKAFGCGFLSLARA